MKRSTCAVIVLAFAAATTRADDSSKPPAPAPAITVDLGGGVTMDFLLVRPGTFTMGLDNVWDTSSTHQVTIAKPFYLGRCEVTQEQWKAVMGTNPSDRKRPKHPVDGLRWADCQSFLAKLNAATKGPKYFLPSEAQWEYACRAGSTTKWCFGDDAARLGDYAWYRANSGGREDPSDKNTLYGGSTHPVGEKKPNAWGFCDMHGNVDEQCADAWHDDYKRAPADGSAWEFAGAKTHVVRGGTYVDDAERNRITVRGMGSDDSVTGVRLARYAETTSGPVVAEPPAASAEVEARVMAILETYRDSNSAHYPDPRAAQLVAIGRPAMTVLVKVICDPANADQWAMRLAATKALPALVVDEDVPTIARRMREGHRELECAFERLDAPASVAAYAALLREGLFDNGLHDAARPHLRDPAIVAACCAWLADPKYDGDLDFAIAKMAELTGGTGPFRLSDDPPPEVAKLERRGDSRQPLPELIPEAAPALEALLARHLRIDARRHVAAALVRIGGKAGVPALIEVLGATAGADGRPPDDYARHAAGKQLNAISGTHLYVGHESDDPQHGWTRWQGNFAEAAKAFGAWWEKSKDALRIDSVTQTWSVR